MDARKHSLRITSTRFTDSTEASINWWSEALRPYESLYSFAARFCVLNKIDVKPFEAYFDLDVGRHDQLSGSQLDRVASILNAQRTLVATVFGSAGSTFSAVDTERLVRQDKTHSVRYCPRCVELGYHSRLHEVPWLERCLLHLCVLKQETYKGDRSNRTLSMQAFDTVVHLMMSNCKVWPRWNEGDLMIAKFGQSTYLRLLSDWLKNVRNFNERQTSEQVWTSDSETRREYTFKHFIARLNSLEQMPEPLKLMVPPVETSWRFIIYNYSTEVRKELSRTQQYAPFWMIFSLFKMVCARSGHSHAFMVKLRSAQTKLHEKHGMCQCRWAWHESGWSSHWRQVIPELGPYWSYQCPYEVAREELESGWGNPTLSLRKAQQVDFSFIEQVNLLREANLITYASDAVLLPNGQLATAPQVWPVSIR